MNQPYQPGTNTMQENVHDPRYAIDPEEESIDLLHYWRVVRKYLFQIIGLAIAVGILAVLVANSMTPIYTATFTGFYRARDACYRGFYRRFLVYDAKVSGYAV